MIRIFRYQTDVMLEDTPASLEGIGPDPKKLVWIDLTEPPQESDLNTLSKKFDIHPLAVAALFESALRPQLQEYAHHIFLNARAIVAPDKNATDLTGLAVVLGERYVLTAHRAPLDLIERTLERLRSNAGHVRELGSDRLFYMLLDGLVDDYFALIDDLSETIDDIDGRAAEKYDSLLHNDVLASKRRLLTLHRAISPLRDALLNLRRTDSRFISEDTSVYIRDVFEHVLQLLDTVETYREVLSNTSELMMAAASNRMNEIMKVLTVITSFFIPLTFIAGFYGMNLMMPEFQNPAVYPFVIAVMVVTVIAMFIWFRRKKWL